MSSSSTNRRKAFEDEAIVAAQIFPHQSGQVRFKGSWWLARSAENRPIPEGTVVRVLDRVGLTLLVEPLYTT